MEPFDKMKGKLREESSLPEGFGWEDMQEGIFEKMAGMTESEPEKKRFEFGKLSFFLLGMVTMLGLIVLFNFLKDEQQTLEHNQESISNLSSSNQLIEPFTTGDKLSKEGQVIPEQATTSNLNITKNHPTDLIDVKEELVPIGAELKSSTSSITETTIEIKDNTTDSQRGTKKTIEIDKEDNILSNAKNSLETTKKIKGEIAKQVNSLQNIKEVEQSMETASPTAFNNNLSSVKTASTHISTKNGKPMRTLNALDKRHFKVIYDSGLSTINPVSLSNPLAVEKRAKSSRFSMAIGVGLNYWTPNWGNSSTSQERALYEKALIGNTYSLQFDYRLTSKWSIGTGVMNSKYYSKFNYKEADTYQRDKNDVLVEIQVNTVTGDSTLIYGDRMVNVNRERTVVHYNTFQKWSIPLMVKYSLRKRKMEYAFGVGTILTLSTETAGKTINSTIQDYNATSPIYQSGLEIGALGSFDLNYHLSEKYYIGAQLSGIGSLKNWSKENDVSLKPIIFNSQLTLGIKL